MVVFTFDDPPSKKGVSIDDRKNLCRPGPMSMCTAKDTTIEMKECKFYRNSSEGFKCMFRVDSIQLESGYYHCSCLIAQCERLEKLFGKESNQTAIEKGPKWPSKKKKLKQPSKKK